jgi:hypothetical protein
MCLCYTGLVIDRTIVTQKSAAFLGVKKKSKAILVTGRGGL